jgi:hypothetical protein
MNLETAPLISSDGFKFYQRVIGRVFGPACVYGQVIKRRRNDRVVSVETKIRDRSRSIATSSAAVGGFG